MVPSFVALAALLASPPVQAQADPLPQVVIPAETVLEESEFRNLQIEGQLVGPGMPLTIERTPKPFPTWISLRKDFSAEMRASVDVVD